MHRYPALTALLFVTTAFCSGTQNRLCGADSYWDLPDLAPTSVLVTPDEPDALVPAEADQPLYVASSPTAAYGDRLWLSADYLLLWTNGNPVTPLVTTNAGVPPRPQAGVLGVGDTQVLVGGRLDEGGRSGVALTTGYWFDDSHSCGFQTTTWYAGDPDDELNDTWSSLGVPVYARPFFNDGSGMEDSQLVAYPNVVAGSVLVATSSHLTSTEALLRLNWLEGYRGRVDLIGGYRYFRFREGVFVEENLISTDPGGVVQVGTTIDLYDRFDAGSSFHGGEIGLLTTLQGGCCELDIATKLGIGNVRQRAWIEGQTVVTTPSGSQSISSGGLLALPSNIGSYSDDAFGLLPELNLQGRVLLTDHLSLNVGYNLLFLTNVYRAGKQIDRVIDPGQLPGGMPINGLSSGSLVRPTMPYAESTLCVQGLNVGCTLTY